MNSIQLIGGNCDDCSWKSVSRCDPAESESERGGTRISL